MLKSSEHEKLRRYLNYRSLNFKDCSEVRSADPPISLNILGTYEKSAYIDLLVLV